MYYFGHYKFNRGNIWEILNGKLNIFGQNGMFGDLEVKGVKLTIMKITKENKRK